VKGYWIIGIIEALIGALGAAAYFLADSPAIAGACALAMAALGIYVGVARATKQAKVHAFTSKNYDKADKQMRDQMDAAEKQVCPLPLPVRAIVVATAERDMGDKAASFLSDYDRAVEAIEQDSAGASTAVSGLASRSPNCHSIYLVGYAAIAAGDPKTAERAFRDAIKHAQAWADPWYGLMLSLHKQDRTQDAKDEYAPIKQVQLMPHAPADDMVYTKLTDEERDRLTAQFQAVMQAQGAIYQIAHLIDAVVQMNETRAALE
jgi:hypothetical protein